MQMPQITASLLIRAPTVTNKNPLNEDSRRKNDKQRVGLGYAAASTIPNSSPKVAHELSSTSQLCAAGIGSVAERRARPPQKKETLGSATAEMPKGDVPSWMLHSKGMLR
jgi:hypothetical protein